MSIACNRSVLESPTDKLIRVQEQVLTELRKRPTGTTGSESAGLRAAAVDQRFVDLAAQVQELVRLQKEAVLDRNLDEQRRQERERQRSPDSVADCVRTLTAKVDDMARVQEQMLDEQQQHRRVAASATEVEVVVSAVVLPVEAAVRPEVVAAAPEEALDAVALVPAPRFSLCPTIVSRAFSFCAVKMMPLSLRT